MGIKLFISDHDGTIVKSQGMYHDCIQKIFHEDGKEPPPFSKFMNDVTQYGIEGFYKKYKISFPQKTIGKMEQKYVYEHINELQIPSDVVTFFAICRSLGIKTVILSFNNIHTIEKVLRRRRIRVDQIVSTRNKTEGILALMELYKAAPDETMFVADTAYDILAGNRAGVKTIGICGGYHSFRKLAAAKPDYGGKQKISSFQEIQKVVINNR